MVPEGAELVVGPERPWISRGGVWLESALRQRGLEVAGKRFPDVGASTGWISGTLAGSHIVEGPGPYTEEEYKRPATLRAGWSLIVLKQSHPDWARRMTPTPTTVRSTSGCASCGRTRGRR